MGESKPSVYVKTLGCKVNTFDSHALENQFRAQGYDLVPTPEGADVTVVNTCSVTANADREARYLARRFRRDSPQTVLVFTGCYAQTDSARLTAMDEVDFVVPNEAKERLVAIVHEGIAQRQAGHAVAKLPVGLKAVKDNRQTHFKSAVTFFDRADSEQTRAFVKIQDGCDGFCTYCLIPYARGASRSVPGDAVVAECHRLVAAGCHELVLTGIHLGDYGRDLEAHAGELRPVVGLLGRILQIPGLGRLRLSSLEPAELSVELADLLAAHRGVACDHFHLPLQSGHDRILKLMRRSYDTRGYSDAVTLIRERFPDACIGADVIPGFPSETEEEFEATMALARDLGLAYLHVFPYSSRPNTAAARMPGHLPAEVVKERAARLRALSTELSVAYARRFVGRTLPVLWEKDLDAKGRRLGRSANYLTVAASGGEPAPGTVGLVSLKGLVEQGRLLGRLLT